MKNYPKNDDPGGERSKKAGAGQPESAASRESFAKRDKRPGEAGLANEARPGLGTRAEDDDERNDPSVRKGLGVRPGKYGGPPKATRYGYHEPRPEPREQDSASMDHEMERSTGASGQASSG